MWKGREKMQKFEYLQNEKSFFWWIKNIFHSFWRWKIADTLIFVNLHFIFGLLINPKFSSLSFLWGEFRKWTQAAWFILTHWLFWVSCRVGIKFFFNCLIVLYYLKLFFGDHRWGVDLLIYIYHVSRLHTCQGKPGKPEKPGNWV